MSVITQIKCEYERKAKTRMLQEGFKRQNIKHVSELKKERDDLKHFPEGRQLSKEETDAMVKEILAREQERKDH